MNSLGMRGCEEIGSREFEGQDEPKDEGQHFCLNTRRSNLPFANLDRTLDATEKIARTESVCRIVETSSGISDDTRLQVLAQSLKLWRHWDSPDRKAATLRSRNP